MINPAQPPKCIARALIMFVFFLLCIHQYCPAAALTPGALQLDAALLTSVAKCCLLPLFGVGLFPFSGLFRVHICEAKSAQVWMQMSDMGHFEKLMQGNRTHLHCSERRFGNNSNDCSSWLWFLCIARIYSLSCTFPLILFKSSNFDGHQTFTT